MKNIEIKKIIKYVTKIKKIKKTKIRRYNIFLNNVLKNYILKRFCLWNTATPYFMMKSRSKSSVQCFQEYYDDDFLNMFKIVDEKNVEFIIGRNESKTKFIVMTDNYKDLAPVRDYIGILKLDGAPSKNMAKKIKKLDERHNIINAIYKQNPNIPVRMNPFAPTNWDDFQILVSCMYLTWIYFKTSTKIFRGNDLFLVNYVDNDIPFFIFENRYCKSTSPDIGCSVVKKWFETIFKDIKIEKDNYPIFECSSKCSCHRKNDICKNRISYLNRDDVPLVVFKTVRKGWALGAGKNMKAGDLVTEYTGVIYEDAVMKKRKDYTYSFDMDYMRKDLEIKFKSTSKKLNRFYAIDSKEIGNESRFANHSCDPNMRIVVSYGVYESPTFHKIFYVMKKDVPMGSELTVKYFYNIPNNPSDNTLKCECGASNCIVNLPIEFKNKH
ncbi:SET domain-containing protein [Strongyloides ratti]|uniref:SET domain-containing protein n=1 Tax=Strongyloides ratti TaxID=34506 RepID=A0A090LGW8_STRRB|nr:SET domain-containing protein [Strongyloides ratti]CEF69046.1 SET domain-containing protein [Strongyloides ratti]